MPVDSEMLKKIKKLIASLVKTISGDTLLKAIQKFIRKQYNLGIEVAEAEFDMNFVRNDEQLKFLNNYVKGLTKSVGDDVSKDLRGIMERAILDGGDIEDVKARVKEEFTDKKYTDRLKTIVRTEGNRAGNYAQLESAKQLPFKVKKYLDVVIDDRTSNICLEEHKKYGEKSKAIPLDEDFEVSVKNKTYTAQAAPFHPNCRSTVRFVEVEE